MNPVHIIVDSTADMTPEVEKRVDIVPLTIHFGEENFVDGVDIDRKTFYEKLEGSDMLPTTSQATPYAFSEVFRQAVDAGQDVVVITISSLLSGTYQSAVMAAEDFPGRIHVVDSKSVTLAAGILAQYALQLVDQGMDAEAIAEKLTQERENVHLVAILDTLEYLKRGGRISRSVAFAGGLLNIKPAICLDGGEVKLIGTARGTKQGVSLLDQKIEAAGGMDFDRPVLLGYTGKSDALLRKYMAESAVLKEARGELSVGIVSGVVGTHAGPGAYAVGFFQKAK